MISNNISGPINIVRLKGKIDQIDKTLYVLFDIHENLIFQTECVEIDSTNIKTYIINNLKKAATENNITYDLFIEYHPIRDIKGYPKDIGRTTKYFNDTVKFITNLYSIENSKIKKKQNIFPNLRTHYVDFRSLFESAKIYDVIQNLIYFCNNIYNNLGVRHLQILIDNLELLKLFFVYTNNVFFEGDRVTENDLKLLDYTY